MKQSTVEERLQEWKKEAGEIPENTCPDIDKLIKEHNKIIEELAYIEKNIHKYESADDLAKDFPSYWFDSVEGIAEELRKDNEQLRELGKFWYEKCEEVVLERQLAEQKAREEERERIVGIMREMEFLQGAEENEYSFSVDIKSYNKALSDIINQITKE